MKRNTLIALAFAVLVWMIYKITQTSLQSSLFDLMAHWGDLSFDTYPWFNATLWDFYCNLLFILIWVWYKETRLVPKIFWTILLPVLGSPGTAIYVLVQLFKLSPQEGWQELFSRRNK